MSGEYFDHLETRNPEERETDLFARLTSFLARALAEAPGLARHLGEIDPAAVNDRAALARLPVLRKSRMIEMQADHPPFGGFVPADSLGSTRVFMSPGPIWEPQGRMADPWNAARALHAAGFRRGDMVHNAFAYTMTPGGFILDEGARALGCTVFPAGTGNTEMQLDAIETLKPAGFTGTPDYLKILLDKATEAGRDASSFKRGLVSGGALFPSLREDYAGRGISVMQCYAVADVGVIAYESASGGQPLDGMLVNEDMILEIVQPGTDHPVPDGDVGEVVVTALNPDYPLVRFATGDLSALITGPSPCGRTNFRIRGWMGRADQTAKIKGMFVHPEQVAKIARRHPDLGRLRLVITRRNEQDLMTLHAESQMAGDDLRDALQHALQDATKLRGDVDLVQPGTLPNDGIVIADERDYD